MRRGKRKVGKKRVPQTPHRGVRAAVSKALELPENQLEGLAQVVLLGNREAVVERCQGVLEYTDERIRLDTGRLQVRFSGRDLRLKRMDETGVTVEGFIVAIDFS